MTVLDDYDIHGRYIDYDRLKNENARIANALRERPFYSPKYIHRCMTLADKLDHCSQWRKYKIDKDGNKRLYDTRYCEQPLCRICERVRYNHQSARLYNVLTALDGKANILFLTLTCKNADYDNVRKTVDELNYSLSKMLNYKAIKPYTLGMIKRLESTIGRDGKCNIHLHVLLDVKPTFYGGTARLNSKQWTAYWTKALNKGYQATIKCKRVKDTKTAVIKANYMLKPDKKSRTIDWSKARDIDKLLDISDEIYRKHKLTLTGIFKDIDRVVNYKYKHSRNYKIKHLIDTGKHTTYEHKHKFDYDSANIVTYTCTKVDDRLTYKKRE